MIRRALIADDDGLSREYVAEALTAAGYAVDQAETGSAARDLFDPRHHQLVFSDLRMPSGDGLTLLRAIKDESPETPVILVTAFGSVECAVTAMREGAEDFLMKPLCVEQIDLLLDRISQRETLRRENRILKACISESDPAADCIGVSPAWKRCVELARRVAATRATVLIRGESGSGKEVIASLLHQGSDRSASTFIRTNCAVLQDSLLSSELFGHEKGAFTGAHERKEGRFELADGGTLFLDEIGEISPDIQAKLLRVLETGEFERVGGKDTLRVDVRVVCATNRDLEAMIAEGTFREDLFYRLNVVPVQVPPLRERPDDVMPLAGHFLGRYAREYATPARAFTPAAAEALRRYDWPGNVRELANVVQRCALLCGEETIDTEHLGLPGSVAPSLPPGLVGETIAEMERRLILGTLEVTNGNKTKASRILGVTARTLSNKMKLYRQRGELPV